MGGRSRAQTVLAIGLLWVGGGGALAVDPARPLLIWLPDGLPITNRAPQGWSDLVLVSIPRLASGELASLPASARNTATRFHTVITANIERMGESGPYRLARVGMGLGMPVEGADRIVRAGGPFGRERLGFLERQVLNAAETELHRARLAATTPTFALLEAPSAQVLAGDHASVTVYYAFRVDPTTGAMRRWVWSIRRTPPHAPTASYLTELPPDLVFECGLDVAVERILGAVPKGWSFAMRALPPGRRVDIPPGILPWLDDPGRIAQEPSVFEGLLVALLDRAAPSTALRPSLRLPDPPTPRETPPEGRPRSS